jgi:hypothetical protein
MNRFFVLEQGLSMNRISDSHVRADTAALRPSNVHGPNASNHERERFMNRRVLTASCRQKNRRNALPTRRRQLLVGGMSRSTFIVPMHAKKAEEGSP